MNLTNEQIGQRIKAVRLEKNLTQTQLAQLLGKSLRTVQSYESGESRILLDTVTTIAHALGVTPTYLLGVSEPQIKLNTLADVVAVLYELNKKKELHFDIDITHEHCDDGNFTASLKFRATDPDATLSSFPLSALGARITGMTPAALPASQTRKLHNMLTLP